MKLISFANQNHGGLVNLKNSIKDGWEHIILGKGVKWENWHTRSKAYIDYLSTLDPKEVVVLCDAFDVLCIRSSVDFLTDFKSLDRKIVIGAENFCIGNCIPPVQWWNEEDVNFETEFKYVNGGLIAGECEALKLMYQWGINQNIIDDQMAIGNYANKFIQDVWIDINQVLFLNDTNATVKYIFNKYNYSIKLNDGRTIKPYFIHFPGFASVGSYPFLNIFKPSKMFKMGENYITVGNAINGSKQINALPCNKTVTTIAMWIERSIYLLLILLIVVALVYVFFRK